MSCVHAQTPRVCTIGSPAVAAQAVLSAADRLGTGSLPVGVGPGLWTMPVCPCRSVDMGPWLPPAPCPRCPHVPCMSLEGGKGMRAPEPQRMSEAGVLAGGSRWPGEGRADHLWSPLRSAEKPPGGGSQAPGGSRPGALAAGLHGPPSADGVVLGGHQPSVVAAPTPANPLRIGAASGQRVCPWTSWRVVLSGAIWVYFHLDDPHPTGQGTGSPWKPLSVSVLDQEQAQDGPDHCPVSPRASGGRCDVWGAPVLVSAEGRSSGH